MSEKVTAMIEEIKGLTVLELSELVHALEEEFGVSAAAMAAPAAGAAALRIAGHGSLHGAQGRGAAARHGGRRGGGADGRLVVAPAFACLGQRDDHAVRLRHGAVHGLVQSPGCQVPHHHRAALGILRGGRRCAALRAKGDHPHRLCRHSRPCAFPDALRADAADD